MPNHGLPLTVRQKPHMGFLMILVGVGVVIAGLASDPIIAPVGAVLGLAGLAMANGPMFVVHNDRIEIKNPLGMTVKRVQVADLGSLSVVGARLVLTEDGEKKDQSFGGWIARPEDMKALKAALDRAGNS